MPTIALNDTTNDTLHQDWPKSSLLFLQTELKWLCTDVLQLPVAVKNQINTPFLLFYLWCELICSTWKDFVVFMDALRPLIRPNRTEWSVTSGHWIGLCFKTLYSSVSLTVKGYSSLYLYSLSALLFFLLSVTHTQISDTSVHSS